MAIAATASGASTQSAAATTLTITPGTAPTNGNIYVIFLTTSAAVTGITVKDSNNVPLDQGPTQGNTTSWFYTVTGSPVSFTAAWTTSVQCSLAGQEYSGAAGVDRNFAGLHNSGSSTTATIAITLLQPNDWIVCGLASAQTIAASVGTQRQQTTTTTARITIVDNTSGSPGTISCTGALTPSSAWAAVGLILGGAGAARLNQEVELVIEQPTSSLARVNQDMLLAVTSPTSAKVRVNQEVLLVIVQRTKKRKNILFAVT